MLFGNVVILQQKLNPPHYAQPAGSNQHMLSHALLTATLRPHSADVWSSPTVDRHRSPTTQQDKARSRDAGGACDGLAQIVSERLVCLGCLEAFPLH